MREAVCSHGFDEIVQNKFHLRRIAVALSVSRPRATNDPPDLIDNPVEECLAVSIPLMCSAMQHGNRNE